MAESSLPSRPTDGKRIVFTGGSGKGGRHVLPYLLEKGHKILNLDLVPFPEPRPDIYTLKTDLTQSGQVFNALTSNFNMAGWEGGLPQPPDVVIHFAAYARNLLVPDNETFQANVTSTYNVIEAGKSGISFHSNGNGKRLNGKWNISLQAWREKDYYCQQ